MKRLVLAMILLLVAATVMYGVEPYIPGSNINEIRFEPIPTSGTHYSIKGTIYSKLGIAPTRVDAYAGPNWSVASNYIENPSFHIWEFYITFEAKLFPTPKSISFTLSITGEDNYQFWLSNYPLFWPNYFCLENQLEKLSVANNNEVPLELTKIEITSIDNIIELKMLKDNILPDGRDINEFEWIPVNIDSIILNPKETYEIDLEELGISINEEPGLLFRAIEINTGVNIYFQYGVVKEK